MVIISAAFTLTGMGVYGISYIKFGWKVRARSTVPGRVCMARGLPRGEGGAEHGGRGAGNVCAVWWF
jgi:hypothetical protein